MTDGIRNRPSVWAKNLAKFLSGDDHCWYKLWLQSMYRIDKVPQTPEDTARMRGHMARHEAIATRRAEELRAQGYVVKTEDDTAFKVEGRSADLTGKCDIVAMKDGQALVVDAKGGKPRDSDHWQVRVYLWALPRTWLQGHDLRGEVQYATEAVPVRGLEPGDATAIGEAMRRTTSPEAPAPIPSKWECAFCPVANCDRRFKDLDADRRTGGAGGLF